MKPIGCDRLGRPRRLTPGCSEQGKLPTAKAFKLAERDKHMSEQKSFMQALDAWTDEAVIEPLVDGGGVEAQIEVRRAIREKVLESYRNGQAAGGKAPARKEWRRYAKAQTR
jgi:hypothetical protein